MRHAQRIEYYDIREEARSGNLLPLVGRRDVLARMNRVVRRRVSSNIMVVGPSGIGKTALVHGWMKRLVIEDAWSDVQLVQLNNVHIVALEDAAAEERLGEAIAHLQKSVVFVDDFGTYIHHNSTLMHTVEYAYKSFLEKKDTHLVLALEPAEYAWIERESPAFVRNFEVITLKEQRSHEHRLILRQAVPRLNTAHHILVPDAAIKEIVQYAERYPMLGTMPRSGIRLLDESLAQSALRGSAILQSEDIADVIETKTGVPRARTGAHDIKHLQHFERDLNRKVIDQKNAIGDIASTLTRAQLGLRNPNRPLGSFLMLGPSGVGKTETAKTVAEMIFGRTESFLRFDMSEFQQDHTVQRLIGAPAGYVGHDEGGALTNALKKDPYSLILLDEIEKAHPKVFDIFLQVLDDGRLTSGQNETVDARNAIVMATSNVAVAEILQARDKGVDIQHEHFLQDVIIPTLAKTFRLEFINRFDKIVLFEPLSIPSLVRIAELEIRKIEQRLEHHKVRFDIDPDTITGHVKRIADPRFGARPIKRFVEETCESLLVDTLMTSAT